MTVWRLTYAARLTARVADASVEELEAYGLIRCVDLDGLTSNKRGPRKYGEVGSYLNPTSKFLEITAKGRKFLEVMEKMAALMPKAPWIMEQY
jgi:predicted transcriptional regulator